MRRVPGQPYTLHPKSCTLHPAPYTLHPTPYALHPAPFTLHPTPYALHQTPLAPRLTRGCRGGRRVPFSERLALAPTSCPRFTGTPVVCACVCE